MLVQTRRLDGSTVWIHWHWQHALQTHTCLAVATLLMSYLEVLSNLQLGLPDRSCLLELSLELL